MDSYVGGVSVILRTERNGRTREISPARRILAFCNLTRAKLPSYAHLSQSRESKEHRQ